MPKATTHLRALPLVLLLTACSVTNQSSPTSPSTAASQSAPASPSAASGEDGLPQGTDPVTLDPADFVAGVDHEYWPMGMGNLWIYRSTDAEGNMVRTEVTVASDTRVVLGIAATVLTTEVTLGEDVVRTSSDWYAQDADGTVWYLGRDAKAYEGDEVVGTDGSWEAGVDGALAGVILPGSPTVGMTFRQAYAAGVVEDSAEVVAVDRTVVVIVGTFEDSVVMEVTSGLEVGTATHVSYGAGRGPVLFLARPEGAERMELTTFVGQ